MAGCIARLTTRERLEVRVARVGSSGSQALPTFRQGDDLHSVPLYKSLCRHQAEPLSSPMSYIPYSCFCNTVFEHRRRNIYMGMRDAEILGHGGIVIVKTITRRLCWRSILYYLLIVVSTSFISPLPSKIITFFIQSRLHLKQTFHPKVQNIYEGSQRDV